MGESDKEYRPLLCDGSDEDQHRGFHRHRHMAFKGRARNNIKGAAAIIKNWPEHWSSSVTYWWIALSMFAVTVFIIYNSVIAYAYLPNVHTSARTHTAASNAHDDPKLILPDVYMNIIANTDKEANLDKFLPYVEIFAKKNVNYKFNVIVMVNDTEVHRNDDAFNNEIALHSLWTESIYKEGKAAKSNVNIFHLQLSSFMDESPLQNCWRQLPSKFLDFLTRAILVWDKGGIALDPIILTPRSPHSVYIEKVQNLLRKYERVPQVSLQERTPNHVDEQKIKKTSKAKSKHVNNIRDIIDALETDMDVSSPSQHALSEAESRQDIVKVELSSVAKENILSAKNIDSSNSNKPSLQELLLPKDRNEHVLQHLPAKNDTELSLFPLFLDFLFNDKSKEIQSNTHTGEAIKNKSEENSVIVKDRTTRAAVSHKLVDKTEEPNKGTIQPMIVPAPNSFQRKQTKVLEEIPKTYDNLDNLTIDLKGKLLATRTSCHSFIGTLFTNAHHHKEDETVTDFIISELSLFCKGVLSACKGIDVMLL